MRSVSGTSYAQGRRRRTPRPLPTAGAWTLLFRGHPGVGTALMRLNLDASKPRCVQTSMPSSPKLPAVLSNCNGDGMLGADRVPGRAACSPRRCSESRRTLGHSHRCGPRTYVDTRAQTDLVSKGAWSGRVAALERWRGFVTALRSLVTMGKLPGPLFLSALKFRGD